MSSGRFYLIKFKDSRIIQRKQDRTIKRVIQIVNFTILRKLLFLIIITLDNFNTPFWSFEPAVCFSGYVSGHRKIHHIYALV